MKVIPLILCLLLEAEGYTISDQNSLHVNLTQGYDRRIRPGIDRSLPLKIELKFYMASLKEFSEGESKIGMVGSLSAEWFDSRLRWDPANFGGDLYETSLFVSDIWAPYLILINPFGKLQPIFSGELSSRIDANGKVSSLAPQLFESTCDADVTYYPFDSQSCTLRFYVPGYYTADILLRPVSSSFDMQLYEENGLWSVTSTRSYYHVNVFQFEELRLEINMRRRTTYYVAGLLLPICLMNFIQVLVFILPVESGERVGFSITVLLAVAVFLTIIQEKLPEASEPSVSYLTYKLLVDMLIGCAMVIAVILGINVYHKTDRQEVPSKLKSLSRCLISCCKRKKSTVSVQKEEKTPVECINDESDCDITWNDVGKAIDKLFLISFFVLLILNNVIYLTAMAALGSS